MAHYKATLETKLPADDAFAYISDFSNTQEWDPGIVRAQRVGEGPIAEGSEFHLVARFLGRQSAIDYRVVAYDPPRAVSFRGENATVVSLDHVTVASAGGATLVTYEAELTLKGPLKLADPLLALAFKRVGDRALAGMRDTLARMAADRGGE